MEQIITIVLSVFGGGALLSFLQFIINRHDTKSGKHSAIMEAINKVKDELDTLRGEINEDRATNARIRILSFSDEIRHNVKHSKESFDQMMQDIDTYKRYCDKHPEYRNNRAVMAITNIERVYSDCLREHNFLE